MVGLLDALVQEASAHGMGLVLRFADSPEESVEIYREWWAKQAVDGVLISDPVTNDLRLNVFQELGLPAVPIGATESRRRTGIAVQSLLAMLGGADPDE